jgi:effector-binding domain-containing protein
VADPHVLTRPEQPYVGIRRTVTMDTISRVADRIPVLIGWLNERGVALAGAPFLRYRVIDMERQLDVEAGVPVAARCEGDGDVSFGVLPAGRYATFTYTGPCDGLVSATAALLAWTDAQGVALAVEPSADGDVWVCRLEIYMTNPLEQPDPARLETELAFMLAD